VAECLKAEKPSTSSAHSSPHATPWALLKLLKIGYTFDIVLPPADAMDASLPMLYT